MNQVQKLWVCLFVLEHEADLGGVLSEALDQLFVKKNKDQIKCFLKFILMQESISETVLIGLLKRIDALLSKVKDIFGKILEPNNMMRSLFKLMHKAKRAASDQV